MNSSEFAEPAVRSKPQAKASSGIEKKVGIIVSMADEEWDAFKLACADEGLSMRAVTTELIKRYLREENR